MGITSRYYRTFGPHYRVFPTIPIPMELSKVQAFKKAFNFIRVKSVDSRSNHFLGETRLRFALLGRGTFVRTSRNQPLEYLKNGLT